MGAGGQMGAGVRRWLCENFLYGFKAAPRAARAAGSGRLGRAPADAPARPASSARPPSAKGKSTGPLNAEEGAQAAARG